MKCLQQLQAHKSSANEDGSMHSVAKIFMILKQATSANI
jgi:hypothetical protein